MCLLQKLIAHSLKARILEPQQPAITRQQPVNSNSGMVVSVRSMPGLYNALSGVFWGSLPALR
jgi:hypothetical protein